MLTNNLTENDKKEFSEDLENIIRYIENVILNDNPSLTVTLNHLILGILENRACKAYGIMSKCISEMAIDTIKESYYKIISNNSLIAVKPNRTISYNNDVIEIITKARNEKDFLYDEKVNTNHIMLAILNKQNSFEKWSKVFMATGLTYNIFLGKMSTEELKEISNEEKKKRKKESTVIGLDISKTKKDATPMMFYGPNFASSKKSGKNEMIETFCTNLNQLSHDGKIDPLIGREKEIENLTYILNKRKKNNAVIVGADGCGKTALCEGLAYLIEKGKCPYSLKDKIIIKADVQKMIAGTQYRGMFEERVKDLFDELKDNKKYILFIDDIHSTMKKDNDTNTDIIPLMSELLEDGDVQIIVTTSYKGYHNGFDSNPNLSRKFQKILLSTPSEKETKTILDGIKDRYSDFHMVDYSDEFITECIKLSKKYITERNLPDSAIDILDEVGALLSPKNNESEKHKKMVNEYTELLNEKTKLIDEEKFDELTELEKKCVSKKNEINKLNSEERKNRVNATIDDLLKVVSNKTGVPLNSLNSDDRKNLSELNGRVKKIVIGQDEAVDGICRAIKRKRVGITNGKSTSILLIGGTGVGKTLIAKTLAKELFGDEKNMVRIDMSEYSDATSVNKLIGSNPGYVGYQEGGVLTEKIKSKKNTVLLLDEIEKADKKVYNLFLQIFDEGFITDNSGQKVDFSNVVILLTSNVGAKEANDFGKGIGFSTNENENKKKIFDKELKRKFPPEFINRLDSVIYFNQLTDDNLKEIIKIELGKSVDRIKEAGYVLKYTDDVIDKLFEIVKKEKGYGARPIIRAIQNEIENPLTDIILDNEIEKEIYRAFVEDEKIKVL